MNRVHEPGQISPRRDLVPQQENELWRGTVVSRSKAEVRWQRTESEVLPDHFSERHRPAEAAHEGRFVLQVDRQTKQSFQTREAAQKAGMALKRAFPILHVGVLDVEEGQSEVILVEVTGMHVNDSRPPRFRPRA
jgi:hypothetical protein